MIETVNENVDIKNSANEDVKACMPVEEKSTIGGQTTVGSESNNPSGFNNPNEQINYTSVAPHEENDMSSKKQLEPDPRQGKESCSTTVINGGSSLQNMQQDIESIKNDMVVIKQSTNSTIDKIEKIHKTIHYKFVNEIESLEKELDQYHNNEKGLFLDDILRHIACIYSNNESFIENSSPEEGKEQVKILLLELNQILELNGVSKLRSRVGAKRDKQHCMINKMCLTVQSELDGTVAKSYNTGFYIGNRTLVHEVVDVYYLA